MADVGWKLPEPISVHEVNRLVMSHGNGLARDLWYPFWSLLSDEFDLIIYDLRNHGWNDIGTLGKSYIPSSVSDHDFIVGGSSETQ